MAKGDYKRGEWKKYVGKRPIGHAITENVMHSLNGMIIIYDKDWRRCSFQADSPENITTAWMLSLRKLAKAVLLIAPLLLASCNRAPTHVPKDLPAYFPCPECGTDIRTAFAYVHDGTQQSAGVEIEGECTRHGTQKAYLEDVLNNQKQENAQ